MWPDHAITNPSRNRRRTRAAKIVVAVSAMCALCGLLGLAEHPRAERGAGSPADPAIAVTLDEQLRVMNSDGSNAATVYAAEHDLSPVGQPTWSPDGRSIAFGDLWSLRRIDVIVDQGTPKGVNSIELVPYVPGIVGCSSSAWSPTGAEIVFAQMYEPEGLWSVPAEGGATSVLYTSPAGVRLFWPAWSPDGAYIAFVEQEPDGTWAVRVLNRATLEVVTIARHSNVIRALDWARTQNALALDLGGNVYRLDIGTGQLDLVIKNASCPAWSPDDSHILFNRSGKLLVLDIGAGKVTSLRPGGDWPDWRRF